MHAGRDPLLGGRTCPRRGGHRLFSRWRDRRPAACAGEDVARGRGSAITGRWRRSLKFQAGRAAARGRRRVVCDGAAVDGDTAGTGLPPRPRRLVDGGFVKPTRGRWTRGCRVPRPNRLPSRDRKPASRDPRPDEFSDPARAGRLLGVPPRRRGEHFRRVHPVPLHLPGMPHDPLPHVQHLHRFRLGDGWRDGPQICGSSFCLVPVASELHGGDLVRQRRPLAFAQVSSVQVLGHHLTQACRKCRGFKPGGRGFGRRK